MKANARVLVLLFAAPLISAGPAFANGTATLTITASAWGYPLSTDYMGLMEAGGAGIGAYDPSNPYLPHLVLIEQQMGIRHWRSTGVNIATDGKNFGNYVMDVLGNPATPPRCLQWNLWAYDVENILTNDTDGATLLSLSPTASLIDTLAFGNESDWQVNAAKDQYIPNDKRPDSCGIVEPNDSPAFTSTDAPYATYFGPDNVTYVWPATTDADPTPGTDGGFRNRWETVRQDFISYVGTDALEGISCSGPDAGDIASVANPYTAYYADGKVTNDTGIGTPLDSPTTWTPWTLQFAKDEAESLKEVTQHLYVGSGSSGAVPVWQSLSATTDYYFLATDEAEDSNVTETVGIWGPTACGGKTTDSIDILYQCTEEVDGTTPPSSDSAHWERIENDFVVNNTYLIGDVVIDHNISSSNPYTVTYPASGSNPSYQVTYTHPMLFQNVVYGKAAVYPDQDTTGKWVEVDRSDYMCPGPHQLAIQDIDSDSNTIYVTNSNYNTQDWLTAFSDELNGNADWPKQYGQSDGPLMPYRMSEFSPFSGPNSGLYSGFWVTDGPVGNASVATEVVNKTPYKTNYFVSALEGLEMFHWWAQHGCAGVTPITSYQANNSPILMEPWGQVGGDYTPEPYAYAWPAFMFGAMPGASESTPYTGGSKVLWSHNNGINLNNPSNLNLGAYVVVAPNDLLVTLINKTFQDNPSGQAYQGINVTIDIPTDSGFTPSTTRDVQTMTLAPADSNFEVHYGDSTQRRAVLGGNPSETAGNPSYTFSTTSSSFPASWADSGTTAGNSFQVTVRSFSALIVDIPGTDD